MNISIVIVAGAIVILLIALMMMIARMAATRKPRRTGKPSSRSTQQAKASTRWRAVRISPGLICCDAVREHDEQVFLSSESPMLPVDGCDIADCRCKYIHLEDRRTGSDRRAQLDELNAFLPFNQVDRRRTPSRRSTDLVD
ncbi:MAG: hypothetical protein PVJ78_09960 [Gammaproteobacteria bacterium]|jgi:hypothetical protein